MTNPTATLLLHLKALVSVEPPKLEFVFADHRKFAFDIAFPARFVAVEIEGGIFGIGPKCRLCGRRAAAGHSSIARLKTDMEKYNLAASIGWCVLRYTPDVIESGDAAFEVAAALVTRGAKYHPGFARRRDALGRLTRRADGPSDRGSGKT